MEKKSPLRQMTKWEFLAAIANSPQTSKTWEYSPNTAGFALQTLNKFGHSEFCTENLNKAITFALVFQEQFLNLDAEGQAAILQVLSRVDENF